MPPKAQKVKTKVKTSGGDYQPSSSDDDAEDITDENDNGLGDIESRLSKLQRMRSTVSGSEAASLEKEIKRVSKLLDDLADMQPDEQLDHEGKDGRADDGEGDGDADRLQLLDQQRLEQRVGDIGFEV